MDYEYIAMTLREFAKMARGRDQLLVYLLEMVVLRCDEKMKLEGKTVRDRASLPG